MIQRAESTFIRKESSVSIHPRINFASTSVEKVACNLLTLCITTTNMSKFPFKEQHTISQEATLSHQNSMVSILLLQLNSNNRNTLQDDTYKMYLQALTDPRTGIPCQVSSYCTMRFNFQNDGRNYKVDCEYLMV